MNKKYRITSKFRFTLFMAAAILCVLTTAGTVLGFNTVNSAALDQYYLVEVESGDTLWDIASVYGPEHQNVRKTVHEICDINEISADQLLTGQKIIVPVYN